MEYKVYDPDLSLSAMIQAYETFLVLYCFYL